MKESASSLRGDLNYGSNPSHGSFGLRPPVTFPLPDSPPRPFLSGPFEGRASIDGATVTLRQVTQEDAGDYRCEISASMDSVVLGEANVTLKVLGTADKTSLWLPENGFFPPIN